MYYLSSTHVFYLQQLLAIPFQCWLPSWYPSLLRWDWCWISVNDELLHLLNQTHYERFICQPHCYQLQLFLLAFPSFWIGIYHFTKPPLKVKILVLKNISTCQSPQVAVTRLVWIGKKLLEVNRESFEGELNNLLLY